jgi:hypothetical protein
MIKMAIKYVPVYGASINPEKPSDKITTSSDSNGVAKVVDFGKELLDFKIELDFKVNQVTVQNQEVIILSQNSNQTNWIAAYRCQNLSSPLQMIWLVPGVGIQAPGLNYDAGLSIYRFKIVRRFLDTTNLVFSYRNLTNNDKYWRGAYPLQSPSYPIRYLYFGPDSSYPGKVNIEVTNLKVEEIVPFEV